MWNHPKMVNDLKVLHEKLEKLFKERKPTVGFKKKKLLTFGKEERDSRYVNLAVEQTYGLGYGS